MSSFLYYLPSKENWAQVQVLVSRPSPTGITSPSVEDLLPFTKDCLRSAIGPSHPSRGGVRSRRLAGELHRLPLSAGKRDVIEPLLIDWMLVRTTLTASSNTVFDLTTETPPIVMVPSLSVVTDEMVESIPFQCPKDLVLQV
ncbi:hypothetical protein TNCV_2140981 [Trichonephila clavipes]|uniref:Uncharacterized protein n=1 Tax=Trichonephila clavipes TaxID=2585209 RepID=A0A8X6RXG0_TRICX|nr:hypothetical protein TNCV_2140981 [Trichonephila clavipes]